MSRGSPLPNVHKMGQIRAQFEKGGGGFVCQPTQHPLSAMGLSATSRQSPLVGRCVRTHALADAAVPLFTSPFSHHPFLAGESEAGAVKITCGGPGSLIGTMAHKDDSGFGGPALDDSPILRGSVQAGCVYYRLAGPPESASLALSPEKNKLRQAGQSIQVVQTIKVARAGSITAC